MNSEFHAMKAEETIQALESSAQGLSEEEVESRLQKFGPNELREKKRTTALFLISVGCLVYYSLRKET
jgi:magnesium-transporting ATPase (P-type)